MDDFLIKEYDLSLQDITFFLLNFLITVDNWILLKYTCDSLCLLQIYEREL